MGHFMGRKWFVLFMKVIIGVILLAKSSTSEDQSGIPATGMLCISDCATCPVICSPPPPPSKSHPSPSPPAYYSPPQSYSSHSPPPPALPLPLPPPRPPPPPSSYSSWGTPPPPYTYWNIPSGPTPPSMGGPHDYPYPYYYFYSSEAGPYLSLHVSSIFFILFSYHVLFFCW